MPDPMAGTAGPGVLIRTGDAALQFDVGRSTTVRLVEAGLDLRDLDAVFVTHHHSDHLLGLADLLISRWLADTERAGQHPLRVFAPDGEATQIVTHLLDVWENEIEMRRLHTNRKDTPIPDVRPFVATKQIQTVYDEANIVVTSIAVQHEPVRPAVAYRIETSDGVVVVSGDTAVCREVEMLIEGTDVVVHEAFRVDGAQSLSSPDALAAYHADTVELGAMAARVGIPTLILTHLVPGLTTDDDAAVYESDVRSGGFTGNLIVARDLDSVTI